MKIGSLMLVVYSAVVKRPRILNRDANKPIIVALHGAGVEADSAFWITSIPAQKYAWVSPFQLVYSFFMLIHRISLRFNIR
jgi:hypothetical protein